MKRFFKILHLYLDGFFLGLCLIVLPAASFILKSAEAGALSDRQYGLSYLPMNISAVAVCLLFQKAHRKWGSRTLLVVSFLALGGYLACMSAAGRGHLNRDVFLWILCANLCLGVGFGYLLSVLNYETAVIDPAIQDSLLLGLHASLGIGAALSPIAVHFFYARGDWSRMLLALFGIWLPLLILSFAFRPCSPRGDPREGDQCLPEITGRPLPVKAWFFLATILIYGIAESITGNWSTIYLTRVKLFSPATASGCLSIFWVMLTLGRILSSFLTLKFDPRWIYRFSPVAMTGAFIYLLGLRNESDAVPAYALIGLSCSYFFPLSIGLAVTYFYEFKESLSGLGVAALMVGVSLGSSLTGFLQDIHWMTVTDTLRLAGIAAALLILCAVGISRAKIPAKGSAPCSI